MLTTMLTIQALDIDAHDPMALARFWQEVLGWRITEVEEDEVVLEPPAGSPQDGVAADLVFLKVRDGKTTKNRLHLDLRPDDQEAEVARLEALGAQRVSVGQGGDVTWVVMADPEGNEFCVLRAYRPDELTGPWDDGRPRRRGRNRDACPGPAGRAR
jgi:predicted enzyme related to lactoylglutathione lyase